MPTCPCGAGPMIQWTFLEDQEPHFCCSQPAPLTCVLEPVVRSAALERALAELDAIAPVPVKAAA